MKSVRDEKVVKNINLFLNDNELAKLSQVSHSFSALFTPISRLPKFISKALSHVFGANPQEVEKFFERSHINKKLILEFSSYKEGSISRKLNKYIIFRSWKSISCLQAAAVSGDNFLVKQLLSYIGNDDNLRRVAAQQLEIVLRSTLYLKPFKELIHAYDVYGQEKSSGKTFLETYPAWTALTRCQQRLPTYGLQEFFTQRQFNPLPSFNNEPERECVFWSGNLLELDSFTDIINSKLGLCKLKTHSNTAGMCATTGSLDDDEISEHKGFIEKLCHVRQAELQKLILMLLTPSEALDNTPQSLNLNRLKITI